MVDDEQAIWDAYNLLLLGPDTERLRKLLVRYHFFTMTKDLPGDIVECGVFKGTGLMQWLKLLQIYCPGSAKRVIGFDVFSEFGATDSETEQQSVDRLLAESSFTGTSVEELHAIIARAGIAEAKAELVSGDIQHTGVDYVAAHPGFRISLLHMDFDLDKPTMAGLEAFWPRVVRGGVVVLDEYAIAHWTESDAVDRFFQDRSVRLQTLHWARTPSAYIVKE
jgi:hypothetical protein